MPHLWLLFCPYLPLPPTDETVAFADWELGPQESFTNRWADHKFKDQATTFLSKFVGPNGKPIKPALLCREGKQLNGQRPSCNEFTALELSLVFAFIDKNPKDRDEGWGAVTADNAELHLWPIDVEHGNITLSTGYLVKVNIGGYKISSPELVLRPPLDLHLPMGARSPDPLVLTGIYELVLSSLYTPGENCTADKVRVAVGWFAKAWSNTRTLHLPERLVFLKTAFEALTGTSINWASARKLRKLFEGLPDTTEKDSEILVWSPEEKPVHRRGWVDKNGQCKSTLITDLEHWFIAFGDARNTIIHEGRFPDPTYSGSNCAYNGFFFSTGEFLLRSVIKVLLSSKLGYDNAWRFEHLRDLAATATLEKLWVDSNH